MKQFYAVLATVFTILVLSGIGTAVHAATVSDVDGNVYRAVPVKGQLWMTQNLNVSHYRNGDPIRHALTPAEWADAAAKKQGAWCYYRNSAGNKIKYGKLYNWYAVNDPRGLSPKGWRIPSDKDWEHLDGAFGGKMFAANHMVAASFFSSSRRAAGVSGGYRRSDGRFFHKGTNGLYWTSSLFVKGYAWCRNMSSKNSVLFRNDTCMENGLSVRCVR